MTRRLALGPVDLVDARPARDHLRVLSSRGIGSRRAADRAGLHRNTVRKIGQGATERVREATATAILAVRGDVTGASS